ncbi:hypothetical protein LVJ59_02765 [Microbacterium sp. KKR3/1]|uniref:hypothetical protein n=1 Tax=Microbacterium sp. KKR3/1 TaxID=2904241 RepID=UPI001E28A418|nr:hypothetical protein [Microbacterium sp. KKR3/1]MCE0507946.1 hypothetical protein [Microbacterium sp. KKR3/1]
MSDLILHTKSRIGGKNADVHIYNNRVEWALEPHSMGYNITALVLPLFTVFLSLIWMRPSFKTQATEVIPASKITSIQTKKDGPVNTKVTVITSGNTIEFRTSHDKAAAIKVALTGLAV